MPDATARAANVNLEGGRRNRAQFVQGKLCRVLQLVS